MTESTVMTIAGLVGVVSVIVSVLSCVLGLVLHYAVGNHKKAQTLFRTCGVSGLVAFVAPAVGKVMVMIVEQL